MSKITFTPCFDATPQFTLTTEGYLKASQARLARTGIQIYRAYELGLEGRPAMDEVKIYRPPEEVFNPDSLASFNGKPVTNDHPTEFVTANNWRDLSIGVILAPAKDGDFMRADLLITDPAAIKDIVDGKRELSNGYSCVYDWTKGVAPNGEAYDGIQRQIVGNHVALVDRARCGSACTITDSAKTEENNMTTRKVTVNGVPLELPEQAAAVVDSLLAQISTLTGQVKAATDGAVIKYNDTSLTPDSALALLKTKDAEITALKKDVMTPEQRDAMVAEWSDILTTSKTLVPNLDTKGKTCDAIRREVITALRPTQEALVTASLGGKQVADADPAAVKVCYNVLAAAVKAVPHGTPSTDGFTQLVGGNTSKTTDSQEELDARSAWLAGFGNKK